MTAAGPSSSRFSYKTVQHSITVAMILSLLSPIVLLALLYFDFLFAANSMLLYQLQRLFQC